MHLWLLASAVLITVMAAELPPPTVEAFVMVMVGFDSDWDGGD